MLHYLRIAVTALKSLFKKTNRRAAPRGALQAAIVGGPAGMVLFWIQTPANHPMNSPWLYAYGFIVGAAAAALVDWKGLSC
jgi:hypothetical protein